MIFGLWFWTKQCDFGGPGSATVRVCDTFQDLCSTAWVKDAFLHPAHMGTALFGLCMAKRRGRPRLSSLHVVHACCPAIMCNAPLWDPVSCKPSHPYRETHTYAPVVTHTQTHAHTHTYISIHTHTCICIHTHTHTCIHTHMHLHSHTYTHLHAHIYTNINRHECKQMHAHVHAGAYRPDGHPHLHLCAWGADAVLWQLRLPEPEAWFHHGCVGNALK